MVPAAPMRPGQPCFTRGSPRAAETDHGRPAAADRPQSTCRLVGRVVGGPTGGGGAALVAPAAADRPQSICRLVGRFVGGRTGGGGAALVDPVVADLVTQRWVADH